MRRKTNQRRLESFGITGIGGDINEAAARHILQVKNAVEQKSLGARLKERILRRMEQESTDEYERFKDVYMKSEPEERDKFTSIYGFDPDKSWGKEAAELDKKRRKKN